MTCLLRWTAFLWTVNSISCTLGMAVSEQTGICVCCLHFHSHEYVCVNMKCTNFRYRISFVLLLLKSRTEWVYGNIICSK